jgi:hypothetical protein
MRWIQAYAIAQKQPPASAESARMLCKGLRARESSLSVLLETDLATPTEADLELLLLGVAEVQPDDDGRL